MPQRLRPEIGRVPLRRTRDSKDALEKCATGIEPVTPTMSGNALPSPPLVGIFGEDSNLQPDRYELGRTRTSYQAVMSEPLRLRKERIFPAYGTKGLNVPARHAVLSNESPAWPGTEFPPYFGLDFPVGKSVHAAQSRPLVPFAVSPRIVLALLDLIAGARANRR